MKKFIIYTLVALGILAVIKAIVFAIALNYASDMFNKAQQDQIKHNVNIELLNKYREMSR